MPSIVSQHYQSHDGSDDSEDHHDDDFNDSDDDAEYEAQVEMSDLEEVPLEDFPSHFTERNNRLFHSTNAPYWLPVDTPEQERLSNLAIMLYQMIGTHNVGPVDEVLARLPQSSRRPMVLDCCTGRGQWVMSMAREYPHAFFRGYDIGKMRPVNMIDAVLMHRNTYRPATVPIAFQRTPNNVVFEIYDVNDTSDPTRWISGGFDLVNSRFVDMAVLDYQRFSQEAARLLRPGGLFLSYEWARLPAFYAELQRDVNTHAPGSVRFFDAVNRALELRNIREHIASHVPEYLTRTGQFTNIVQNEYHIPIGGWPTDPALRELGMRCLEAQEQYTESVRTLLADSGLWTEDDIIDLVSDFVHEIHNVHGLVSILYTVHARRL